VRSPCARFCWVLKDAPNAVDVCERRRKAAAVISWTVVIAAPLLEINKCKCAPPLAWRVRYDWVRSGIAASITSFVPRVNAIKPEVHTSCFNEQGSNHGTSPGCFDRTPANFAFASRNAARNASSQSTSASFVIVPPGATGSATGAVSASGSGTKTGV